MRIINPSVTLVSHTLYPEYVIERMGRVCYQSTHKVAKCPGCIDGRLPSVTGRPSFQPCDRCSATGVDPESPRKFIRMIIKRGHESVLEHASASFSIICDRGVTHELVRHRIASFSQESTRYCNYFKEQFGKEIQVIGPPFAEPQLSAKDFIEAIEFAEKKYFKLLANGEKPENARAVLPTCLKAEIGVTANFREWRHFLRLRTSSAAHPQMREIAGKIKKELIELSRACFEDLNENS